VSGASVTSILPTKAATIGSQMALGSISTRHDLVRNA
jgi:hypothetical protein